ncbi:hypothetical protein [Cohnella silvisoli]|uniref:MarR family transcriptional regulator n=1 Tax=Cohnella silvisoli TaxID=2873699 RepID=A0ABV1KZL7_9BACL|nr:hypothetical protein [Cohnella silvisoli]MCD9024327.1 hypothetical protein [Cohnella silvisoli]
MSDKLGIQTYFDEDAGRTLTLVDETEYDVIDRAQREAAQAYYKREAAIKTGGNTRYVNSYHEPIKSVSARAPLHVLGALLKLLPYMSYEHRGVLIRGSKRMGIDEVASAIGKKPRASKEIVRQLRESGVLITEKESRRDVYSISSEYHTIGYVNQAQRYTKLYQTAARERLGNVSISAAGLLYKMLPYFSYEYYYLCENPDERSIDLVKALTIRGLARLIGEDHAHVMTYLRELSRYGFVMVSGAYDTFTIKVNPDVMYRKKYRDEYAQTLSADFRLHERTFAESPEKVVQILHS